MHEVRSADETGPIERVVLSLVRMPKGPARYGVATRAALAMSMPVALLTLLGHQEIGLMTAAGAFTALFAAQASARERAKMLPFVMLAIMLSALLGVWLTAWLWAYAIGLVGLAVATCALSYGFRLGPPGPVFFVLVYGLAANVTALDDGERFNSPLLFLAATGAGCLFAYALAILPLVMRAERARPARPLNQLFPGPWLGIDEQLMVLRVALTSVIGTTISVIWLDATHAYWTVCACIAVVGLTGSRLLSLTRGLHRTIGTLLGALLYLLIAPISDFPWALVIALGVLQFIIEFVVVRNYALALTFVTPLVLLITAAASPGDTTATALERVVDTVLGAALAVLSAFIHRRPRTEESSSDPHSRIDRS